MSDNTRASTAVFRRTTCRERANFEFSRTSCCSWQRHISQRPWIKPSGGARRDRTDDLLLAKQALSQLSYGPVLIGLPAVARGSLHRPPSLKLRRATFAVRRLACQPKRREPRRLVGLGRFELPTSRLSSARSNQLSYKPGSEHR